MNKPPKEVDERKGGSRKGVSHPIVDEHDRPPATSTPDHERDEHDAPPPSSPAP